MHHHPAIRSFILKFVFSIQCTANVVHPHRISQYPPPIIIIWVVQTIAKIHCFVFAFNFYFKPDFVQKSITCTKTRFILINRILAVLAFVTLILFFFTILLTVSCLLTVLIIKGRIVTISFFVIFFVALVISIMRIIFLKVSVNMIIVIKISILFIFIFVIYFVITFAFFTVFSIRRFSMVLIV